MHNHVQIDILSIEFAHIAEAHLRPEGIGHSAIVLAKARIDDRNEVDGTIVVGVEGGVGKTL